MTAEVGVLMDCPESRSHLCRLYKRIRKDENLHDIFYCEQCGKYYMASDTFKDGARFFLNDKVRGKIFIKNIHTPYIKEKLNIGNIKARDSKEYKKALAALPKIKSEQTLMVMQDVFRCSFRNHTIIDMDVSVAVLNKKYEAEEIYVHCGYCEQCNRYFILRAVYDRVKRLKGVPLCHIIDAAEKGSSTGRMDTTLLREESTLMRYGYSVSKEAGLGRVTRWKILATLVDYKLLTISEIISYLTFFINMRWDNPMQESAIGKWNEDITMLSEYRPGSYTREGEYAFFH